MWFHRTRGSYWSNSALAGQIRSWAGYAKPEAATWEEWEEWRHKVETEHKFANWLTEEFLDTVQDVVMFPYDVWDSIRIYIRNRFIDRLHLLDTKLPRGEYRDFDTRLLHAAFEGLVDFIECEKAWMAVVFDKEKAKQYGYPTWSRTRWLRLKSYRCAEAGIDHLKWEMELGEASPLQAEAAKEQYELYNWWKNVRSARPDPYKDESVDYKTINAIEEQYEEEDRQMFVRLVNIRRSLWT